MWPAVFKELFMTFQGHLIQYIWILNNIVGGCTFLKNLNFYEIFY